jgi:AcrR family transcriptional regulator
MSGSTARPLSVDAIVDVAIGIDRAEGHPAISLRRIADEFGVTAMALYSYIDTKHHLLELVADRYMAELDLAEDVEDWRERLRRVYTSFHRLLVARPVLAHVLTRQTVDAPAAYRMLDVVLGILRRHDFDEERAVGIAKILAAYTLGMALSQGPRTMSKQEQRVRLRRLLDAEDDYPRLSAVASTYVTWPESLFHLGLDQLISAQVSS